MTNAAQSGSKMARPNTWAQWPDANGRFGEFGGRFVAETLMPLVLELEQEYARAKADPKFQEEFDWLLKHYVGRASPMYFAERMTQHFGGAKIYFKRDELNYTGAHKINNCIGQVLLARPGVKDQAKVKAFIEAAKGAG